MVREDRNWVAKSSLVATCNIASLCYKHVIATISYHGHHVVPPKSSEHCHDSTDCSHIRVLKKVMTGSTVYLDFMSLSLSVYSYSQHQWALASTMQASV